MAMTDHEVSHHMETWFSMEPDGEGTRRPTLWDKPGEGRVRAVALFGGPALVEIHTDPYVVGDYLDD